MALTDLLSTVSIEALEACKFDVLCASKSILPDGNLPTGEFFEIKTASPTGRLTNREPEYQVSHRWLRSDRISGKKAEFHDIDLASVEKRITAYFEDQLLGAVSAVTTNQMSAEEESLTLEKLKRLMIEHGLMKPQPRRDPDIWSRFGIQAVRKGKGWIVDMEACS